MAAAICWYGATDQKRIMEPEQENARLKRMNVHLAMELDTAKYLFEKVIEPCDRQRFIFELRTEQPKEIGNAYRLLRRSRNGLCYQSVKNDGGCGRATELFCRKQPVVRFPEVLWPYQQCGQGNQSKAATAPGQVKKRLTASVK